VTIVHFDSSLLKVVGANHPFGSYGIVMGVEERDDGILHVRVNDANPNSFLRNWQLPASFLYDAMSHRMSRRHRTRGVILLRRVPAAEREQRAAALPPRMRDFDLAVAPLLSPSLISASPHVQCLSLAFAQLDHYFSPEEIFYEAFLKTATAQRRRGSQAVAWRSVDISMTVLNTHITTRFLSQMATSFLAARHVYGLQVKNEKLDRTSPDTVRGLLQEATARDADHVLLVNYAVREIHGEDGMGNSMAIVQGYDPRTSEVTLLESEYCLFGARWVTTVASLIAASCAASAEGDVDFIVVRKGSDEAAVASPFGASPF